MVHQFAHLLAWLFRVKTDPCQVCARRRFARL